MNEYISILDVSNYICLFDDIGQKSGMKFKMGENFEEYVEITTNAAGKSPTQPHFQPDSSRLEPGRAFWIVGEDQSGKVAHVQALRVDDLKTTNLAEHLESLEACYADPKIQARSGSSCVCRAPTARNITRLVAYQGDIWLREDFRGQGLPRTFSRIAFGLAWAKWSPDFIYALVPNWSIEKGVADQYGYLHREAQVVLSLPDLGIEDDDWLIWLTRRELSQLIKGTVAKTPAGLSDWGE
ncbi:hypothetical protein [Mesorhizobium sp.]|uniref:hypothetical protein n=1 Tax=Mesorhizobium sp. TaxID=1871066 RepID=UPI001224494D|nr:hypothetical protein [Mesorhizobium sp.]TIL34592.1 MAG: hypothetical protein E5Y85_09370 [Mesorhizobium sp.]TIM48592.1 MAG: hypothetical protein E5Y56_06390 [Mesorhizobium sp.]